MITVGEMKKYLDDYDDLLPFLIRKSEGNGYYSDWKCSLPAKFYPGDAVQVMAYEPYEQGCCDDHT